MSVMIEVGDSQNDAHLCHTTEDVRMAIARRAECYRRRLYQMLSKPILPPGAYASVAEYVAERGRSFVMSPWPRNAVPMKKKDCFSNAWNLAQFSNGSLLYVEGFASDRAHHHAWVWDPQTDTAYDPTWEYSVDDNVPYLGCAMWGSAAYPGADCIDDLYWRIMRDQSMTQSNVYTPFLYRLARARRGDHAPIFGPWIGSVRHSFSVRD